MTSIVREALEAVAKGLVGVSGKAIVLNSDASVVLSKVAAALAVLDATPGEGEAAALVDREAAATLADAVASECEAYKGNVARSASAFWARKIAAAIRALPAAPLSGSVVK